MKINLTTHNFNSKILTPLVLWFYLNICFGYSLSKIFYDFLDQINKTDIFKSIQFRKKFSFKNLMKIIINFFWKLIMAFKFKYEFWEKVQTNIKR